MGFQLVIATGKEAGREFVFDQRSVLIGRTGECDVVLYDAGVSRHHARVVEEPLGVFIDDLGSSNGTRVNGVAVKLRTQLKNGDVIVLGAVTFTFSLISTDTVLNDLPLSTRDPEAIQETRILQAAEMKTSRNRGVAAVPAQVAPGELEVLRSRRTSVQPAVKWPSEPVAVRRRDQRFAARLMISWLQASRQVRRAFMASAVVVLLLMVVLIARALSRPAAQEPSVLTQDPIEASFGVGGGVTYEHLSEVVFKMPVKAPVPVVAVIHFESRDIALDEVKLSVNGKVISSLEPDGATAAEEHEVVVPQAVLTRNAMNEVRFQNLRTPGTWQVARLWVELVVLPGSEAEAQERYRRAEASTRPWEAYRGFRETWLMLESLPASQRGALSVTARQEMLRVRAELDQKCDAMLERNAAAEEVRTAFPSRLLHPCQRLRAARP